MSEEGLIENNEIEETPVVEIPEGFDADVYDIETKSLRSDKVLERFQNANKEIENYKKQALDLRRKLSKGVEVPDSVDKYEYTPDTKYDKYLLNDESVEGKHVKEVMDTLSKFSLDNGLSIEASKNLKDFALKYMEEVSILDSRSDEELKEERAKHIEKQRKILGEHASEIIADNANFYKEYGFFDKDERELVMEMINESAVANKMFAKVRSLFNGSTASQIPQSSSDNAGRDTLANEYMDSKTSDTRREQILKQFASNGWSL